jgi:hypothetical protein
MINIKYSKFKYKEIMNQQNSIDSIRRLNLSIKWKKKKQNIYNWMTSIEIENRQDKWFNT